MNESLSPTSPNVASPRRAVAEIISIGDEIATGAILDTNAQYLSRSLSEIGVRVLYHSTVDDDMSAMVAAFSTAFRRADVVLITGGLGPTQDDLTRQASAKALGVDLVFDSDSFEHTKKLFARRGRIMPESNKIQAYFPRGAAVIFNPNGTAPGFLLEGLRENLPQSARFNNISNNDASSTDVGGANGSFVVLSFPGVPAEMKEMWAGSTGKIAVEKFATRLAGGVRPIYRNKTIHTFGAGESAIEARLPNLIARDRVPTVGITAKESIITLRIFAEGSSQAECDRQIEETSKIIYAGVGDFVFGEDAETFPEVICRNLRAQARKVAVCEWGTRGFLTTKFDSDVLAFGKTFGNADRARFERLFGMNFGQETNQNLIKNNAKSDLFGAKLISKTEISAELKEFLATETPNDVDYCLAIGPFPLENSSEPLENPPTAVVAFVDLRDRATPILHRETFAFGGHPAVIDALFCNRALDMLRKYQ